MSQLHQISGCQNASRRADVLFIHGLGGDAFGTWRSGNDAASSWPHWVGDEFSDVGVWSLGYAASPTKWAKVLRWFGRGDRDSGHAMALPDRAQQVLNLMTQHGLGQRPLLLVCHSLGGLLGKQLLRSARDSKQANQQAVAQHTRAVLFLATPHAGAELASMLDAFSAVFGATVSIENLRAHDAHLRDLSGWYADHAPDLRIETATYYELRPVHGLATIVNPTSAHPGVGRRPVGLDEDHGSIAKPRDRNAQVCGALRELLAQHVLCASASVPPTATPQPAPAPIVVQLTPTVHSERVPCELPPSAQKFIGRVVQKARLIDRLQKRQPTAVVGPAGIGKTALAAEALVAVVGVDGAALATSPYPDGVVYLDLYALQAQAELAWGRLANRLCGLGFEERRTARDRATEACRARRFLLVIEGGEEADGNNGRTTLPELLSVLAPEGRALILTRDSSQAVAAETVALTDVLSPPEAAELLNELMAGRTLAGEQHAAVLALLDGHPLALYWAGSMLARPEEDPGELVQAWATDNLPGLRAPDAAQHTLRWLFSRSIRGLDETTLSVLAVAGLMAHAPCPVAAFEASHGELQPACISQALKRLAQRGMLHRHADGTWQASHVLGYRFSRELAAARLGLLTPLCAWLHQRMAELLLPHGAAVEGLQRQVAGLLLHAASLLKADVASQQWRPLAEDLIYDFAERLTALGDLPLVQTSVNTGGAWLFALPANMFNEQRWQRELGVSHNKVGDVRLAQGDLARALQAYQASLDVSQRLAQADASHAGWQRDLSVSHNKVGDVRRAQGDLAGALQAYQASLDVRQRLAQADASHAGWQRDLSVSHNKVGDVRLAQGDLAGALQAYQASLDVRQRLAQADASHAGWQRDLSFTLTRLAELHAASGDAAAALPFAERSLAIDERLAALDSTNAMWQRDVLVSRALVDRLRTQA